MNKNIKELADEAGLLTYNPEGVPTKFEKFAELLVLKCASIIEAQDVSPAFKLRMSWAVKKYFGVEE